MIEKTLAERHLIDFVRLMWPAVEPGRKMIEGWVMDAICEHLEAVIKGDVRRLLMNVPPGTSKSLLTNVFAPAWAWGPLNKPSMRFISASYSQSLSVRDNVRFRQVIRSDLYQQYWGDRFKPSDSDASKVKFANDQTGWKLATSVGGTTTGERCDCLLTGTPVTTICGVKGIEDVAIGDWVLSYDSAPTYRRVVATARHQTREHWEIRTAGGALVRATSDHRFFTSDGWKTAQTLFVGDILLRSVRQSREGCCGGNAQKAEKIQQCILQPRMHNDFYERRKRDTSESRLHDMWQNASEQTEGRRSEGVFAGMLQRSSKAARLGSTNACAKDLRSLRNGIPREKHDKPQSFLQSSLQRQGAFERYSWGEESWLARRCDETPATWPQFFHSRQTESFETRREVLCGVLQQGQTSCSPHKHERDRQPVRKPSDYVLQLPHEAARGGAFRAEEDKVVLVERVCEDSHVYDIQIEETHCFFAGDILVHNCFILDDANSVSDVESDAVRSTTNQWLTEVVPTRLNSPEFSSIVCIQQRVHEEDATGVLSNIWNDPCWLVVPMEYEPDRHCETSIGWSDPRTEEGQLAWPARFPAHVVKELKQTLGPYASAGQLQQSPTVRGGSILRRDWWQPWTGTKFPPMSYIVAGLDGAFSERDEADPSALVTLGVFMHPVTGRSAVMLMHAWAERLELHALVKRVSESCTKRRVDMLLIENKGSGIPVQQEYRRLYRGAQHGVLMVDPAGKDKVSRAHSVVPIMADGGVFAPADADGLPATKWCDEMITEAAMFPRGAHDDRVDAFVMCMRYLRDNGMLERNVETKARELDENMFARDYSAPYEV